MSRFSAQVGRGHALAMQHAGEEVAYHRDDVTPPEGAPVMAIPGQTNREGLAGDGGQIDSVTRDWLIDVADFAVAGLKEPVRGDEIEHAGQRFRVLASGAGLVAYRWTDQTRTRYRIRTRQVTA